MDKGYSGLNPFKSNSGSIGNITPLGKQGLKVEQMRAPDNIMVIKAENIISEQAERAIKGHPFAHPKYSPIKIPYNASIKKQSKISYEQVKYTWKRGQYKYEARWHTSTPGSPNNKQSWVVIRTKKGAGANQPIKMVRSGNKWVSWNTWHAAIMARKNGVATKAQINLLNNGHFTRKRGK